MTISHKGQRKITVENQTYLWYVKENDDGPGVILTVLMNDKVFLKNTFTNESRERICYSDGCVSESWGISPSITPSAVRAEILEELENVKMRGILSYLPDAEAPDGWKRALDLPGQCPYGIGFDQDSEILLAVYYPQSNEVFSKSILIKLYDLNSGEEITTENANITNFSIQDGACTGIGTLTGRKILFAGWDRSFIPFANLHGDTLYQPSFSPSDIYFQPSGRECLNPENNQGCIRIWHGAYPHKRFGFSASGCYFAIVRDKIITVWKHN